MIITCIRYFVRLNISFMRVIETSQGDVSFTHPKQMLLQRIIKIDRE